MGNIFLKKIILITCLLFFQSLLPSYFGLHRAQLGKAFLVTAGTAAVGVGGYYLNKRGEERYKAAFAKCHTVDAPPEISTGWRIARNLLTVLSGADKAHAHSWLPHKKFWDYLAQKTGLNHIINKDMILNTTPIAGSFSPHTPTPPQTEVVYTGKRTQCIGWEPHMPLLALLTVKGLINDNTEQIKSFIDNLHEMNGMDKFRVHLFSNNSPVYLDMIVKDPNTTAYSSVLVNSSLTNILVIYEKQLHKFTFDTRSLIRDCSEEKNLDREALKLIYQFLLQRKKAIKTLCLSHNKKGLSVFPEALQTIAEYL